MGENARFGIPTYKSIRTTRDSGAGVKALRLTTPVGCAFGFGGSCGGRSPSPLLRRATCRHAYREKVLSDFPAFGGTIRTPFTRDARWPFKVNHARAISLTRVC